MARTGLRACTASLLATTLALGAAACSGSDSDDSGAAPTPSVTPTPTKRATGSPTGAAPVALTSGGPSGSSCLTRIAPRDLAWFDVTWKARTDLDSLRFRLTDPVGVGQRLAGTINVPPVNYGGRIAYGGEAFWPARAKALDTGMTSWVQHAPMWTWSPAQGETGLAVLHIVLDEKALHSRRGASFSGVRATYRTVDGETGSVAVRDRSVYRARPSC